MNKYFLRVSIVLCYTFLLIIIFMLPLLIPERSLQFNLYAPADIVDHSLFQAFEKATGSKINIKFYDDPGECVAQARAGKGAGYDLIIVPHFVVETLKNEGIIRKFSDEQAEHRDELMQRFLGLPFDQNNEYSLPWAWSFYGIAYDKHVLSSVSDVASWSLIFEPYVYPEIPYRSIALLDEPRQMLFLAGIYLNRSPDQIHENMSAIEDLLKKHRPWVESYISGNYHYYLAGGLVPLMVVESPFIKSIVREAPERFGFLIPKEGSILVLYTLVISQFSSQRKELDQLISFMFSHDVGVHLMKTSGYNSAHAQAYDALQKVHDDSYFFPKGSVFDRLHFIHNNFSVEALERLFLRVKLSESS